MDKEIKWHCIYGGRMRPGDDEAPAAQLGGDAGEELEAANTIQLRQRRCQQDALPTKAQDSAPYEQNISPLQCNTALSCRGVVFSLREVHQDELQAIG